MAEKKVTEALAETKATIGATLESSEGVLESLRETIEALDNFETRWKDVQKRFGDVLALSLSSALGVAVPCTLTDEEKQSVFGGKPSLVNLCSKLKEGYYHKVIVLTGAGVSVSAGIPDFRSPGSGLYETLDLQKFQVPSPQALFDIDFFRSDPKPFFMLSKELFYSRSYKPTIAHYFIRLLSKKGLLHRCYTQNIDSLEGRAGIPKPLLVQAHGTFAEATCTNRDCKKKYSSAEMKIVELAVAADKVPTCEACNSGVVKPDVVFFGEDLSGHFKELLEPDFDECDLLIVMGTSLQVQPFSSLIQRVKQTTPRLLINKVQVGSFTLESEGGYRDIAMLEECDSAVQRICKLCDWSQELDALVKGTSSQSSMKTTCAGGVVHGGTKPKVANSTSVYETHNHTHLKQRKAPSKK